MMSSVVISAAALSSCNQQGAAPAIPADKAVEAKVEKVLKGMLPKTKLGAKILKNIYVYDGPEHPHQAQNPKTIDINALK